MSNAESSGQFDKRGDWARWLVLLILVLALVGPLLYRVLSPLRSEPETAPGVGEKLTFVQLDPLTSEGRSLNAADLDGKVVLMNFWGTWCPPCVAELPHIAAIYEKFEDRDDFKLLAVSCGGGRGDEDIPQLLRETGDLLNKEEIDIPTYTDPQHKTRDAASQAGGFENAYPTTLVLDRGGAIRGVWKGFHPKAPGQMETLINRLLKEPPTGGG